MVILRVFGVVCLAWLTGEILLRRLVYEQFPSQLNSFFVFSLIFINGIVVVLVLKKYLNRSLKKGTTLNRQTL